MSGFLGMMILRGNSRRDLAFGASLENAPFAKDKAVGVGREALS